MVAEALATINDPRAIDPLVAELKIPAKELQLPADQNHFSKPIDEFRRPLLQALARLSDPRANAALNELEPRPSPAVPSTHP